MNKKMNVLKIGLALAIAMIVTGCAAISQKEAMESYGSGQIVYFEVNRPYALYGEAAIKQVKNERTNICHDLGVNYCDDEFRKNLTLHSGNTHVSITKTLKLAVLTPKDISVKKYDIIKARFIDGRDAFSPIAHFIEVADPADCKWDGTGVICKSGWDYRKDLPVAMR